MAKLKLLVCCGNGAGTSMMIKLNVEKVAKKMGLDVQEIHHCAVSEGSLLLEIMISYCVQKTSFLCLKTQRNVELSCWT